MKIRARQGSRLRYYNGLDDRDTTVDWLERTYAGGGGRQLPFALRVGHQWDQMRSDNRFLALLETQASPTLP